LPAPVAEGLALARLHKPDLALVDPRLGGDELGTEVAAQLAPLGNGGGFKAKLDSKRHGLGLVRRLVEQVHGTATVNSDHGTTWSIAIPTA
jgi:hypothetical protein